MAVNCRPLIHPDHFYSAFFRALFPLPYPEHFIAMISLPANGLNGPNR